MPFVYRGAKPCTLLEQCVSVGGPVITGCCLAVVSLAEAGHGYQEEPDDDTNEEEKSGGDEEEVAAGGNSNYKQEEDSNSSVSEEAVASMMWEVRGE
jgi:hypothetical protein